VSSARDIVTRGTSAHRQLRVYEDALRSGASDQEALESVVDWLVLETARLPPLPS
jgi:carboxylate-amine ligase